MEWIRKNLLSALAVGTVVYVLFHVANRVAAPIDTALAIPANLLAMVPLTLVGASLLGLLWIVPRRLLDTESRGLRLMPTRSLFALAAAFMLADAAVVVYTALHPRTGSTPSVVLGFVTLYCFMRLALRIREVRNSGV